MARVAPLAIVSSMAVGLASFFGCSDSGPETVPVYGKVTMVGRKVPKHCRVFFRPVETSTFLRPSSATVRPDGSYEAKAYRDSKGLLPGTYKVRVLYYNLKPGANPDLETSYVEASYEAGELVVDPESSGIEHDIEVPQKPANPTGRR